MALLVRPSQCLCLEIRAACFHSSAIRAGSSRKRTATSRPSARTRLVKDLKPKISFGHSRRKGKLEVAPRTPRQKDDFFMQGKTSSHSRSAYSPRTQTKPGLRETPAFQDRSRFGDTKQIRELPHGEMAQRVYSRNAERFPVVPSQFRNSDGLRGTKQKRASLREPVPHMSPRTEDDRQNRVSQPVHNRSDLKDGLATPPSDGLRGTTQNPVSGREPAPHLSPATDEERQHWAYQRVRDRTDFKEALVTPSSQSKNEALKALPTQFTSPPLMEGLVTSLRDILGPKATPTPIQALSLKHVVSNLLPQGFETHERSQFLLASETGSGKSFAYLLPVLQDLKNTEFNSSRHQEQDQQGEERARPAYNPRAIILAPTHELSRQLSMFAKSLSHNIKLRILCVSRANTPTVGSSKNKSASKMASDMAKIFGEGETGSELEVKSGHGSGGREIDVLVGTPMKLLEMLRGRYWNQDRTYPPEDKRGKYERRRPELGLERVEWVVVDEADVLFDPDFRSFTQELLSDISRERGHPVSISEEPDTSSAVEYPFHLILTTATIPASLSTYIETHHPSLTRLASPNLHRLPRKLQTEHMGQSSGNRNADVEKRIKQVWADDAIAGREEKSRVVIFCNRSTKVADLCKDLEKAGIKCAEVTSMGAGRKWGSNKHLNGFLKDTSPSLPKSVEGEEAKDSEAPHVLVTTSLLSRGLDFSPSVSHVFILDEPRNKVDFLHRAGRTGRAGARGTVVIFGSGKREADLDRDLKRVRY